MNPRPPPCEGDALPAELLPHRWSCFVVRAGQDVKACVGWPRVPTCGALRARARPLPASPGGRRGVTAFGRPEGRGRVQSSPREDARPRKPRKSGQTRASQERSQPHATRFPAAIAISGGMVYTLRDHIVWLLMGPCPARRIRPDRDMPSCPVCRDAFFAPAPRPDACPAGGRARRCLLPFRQPPACGAPGSARAKSWGGCTGSGLVGLCHF